MAETSDPSQPEAVPIRAAQYIRMSTEHQQYSTANQADSIQEYAQKRGFEIKKTYADEGKSGLRIEGRDALRQLIEDVEAGNTDFDAVLVYDVSRWGRFQDSDESAYYEFACKRAGIQVYYCAEQFENDGSPAATIIKGVKRAMAGEYSRELSTKVFKGQCRLIQLGVPPRRPGGLRPSTDAARSDGTTQRTAGHRRSHKSLQTDRVTLVPGPPEEQDVVRRIYEYFTRKGMKEREIAERLNADGLTGENGRKWSRSTVRQILTNEKYIGHNVYNRVSFKLKKKRVQNPPEMWVRKDDAFEPIVDAKLFHMAEGIILERSRVYSDEEMLTALQDLLAQHGTLSSQIINSSDLVPSSSAYQNRFGGLIEAYRLAGYDPQRDYSYLEVNRSLKELHPQIIGQVIGELRQHGAEVVSEPEDGSLLINDCYRVSIVLSRYRETQAGSPRWLVRFGSRDKSRSHAHDSHGCHEYPAGRLLLAPAHRYRRNQAQLGASQRGRDRHLPLRLLDLLYGHGGTGQS